MLLVKQHSPYLLRPRGLQIPAFLTNGKMRCLVKSSHHFSEFAGFNQFHAAGSCCSFALCLDPCLKGEREVGDTRKVSKKLANSCLKEPRPKLELFSNLFGNILFAGFCARERRRRKAK